MLKERLKWEGGGEVGGSDIERGVWVKSGERGLCEEEDVPVDWKVEERKGL